MTLGIGPSRPHRGTLQPEQQPLDALKCEVCSGWFTPDESNFGCPYCAAAGELQPVLDKSEPPP